MQDVNLSSLKPLKPCEVLTTIAGQAALFSIHHKVVVLPSTVVQQYMVYIYICSNNKNNKPLCFKAIVGRCGEIVRKTFDGS